MKPLIILLLLAVMFIAFRAFTKYALSRVRPPEAVERSLVMFSDLSPDDPLFRGEVTLDDLTFLHIPKTGGTLIENLIHFDYNLDVGRFDDTFIGRVGKVIGNEVQEFTRQVIRCSRWHIPSWRKSMITKDHVTDNWAQHWLSSKKFTVVRNPVTRLISEYNYIVGHQWGAHLRRFLKKGTVIKNVHDYCKPIIFNMIIKGILKHVFEMRRTYFMDCHFIPQIEYVVDETGAQISDYILRQENLTSEILTLFSNLNKTITRESIIKHGNNHLHISCQPTEEMLDSESRAAINKHYEEDFRLLGYKFLDVNSTLL